MSTTKGKLVTCNRCGETIFLKYLDTYTTDGGFGDKYDKYEELPDDWLYISQIGDLCPQCANEFKKFVNEFTGGKVAPVWKIEREAEND